ncbi:MAG: hypothetical protein M0Q02_06725, partial [Candidatus Muirbacterium halophilum]|nr:hypothetical protein [Candidatus Muirbacterium halophilum]
NGFVKEELFEDKDNRSYFNMNFKSHEGDKNFELWAYDTETSDYEMIYGDYFHLNQSKKIVYNYDKNKNLENNELLFKLFYFVCFLMIAIIVIRFIYKKYIFYIFKNMNKKLFESILDDEVNIIMSDKYIFEYFTKATNKKLVFVEDIIDSILKIIQKKLFIDEINISCKQINNSIYNEIKKIAYKENIKINVFTFFVEKPIKCVKIIAQQESNIIYYVEKNKINFAFIKKHHLFPVWGMTGRLDEKYVLEEKQKN